MSARKHFVLCMALGLRDCRCYDIYILESGELEPDRRGKHSDHPLVSEEIKEKVQDHRLHLDNSDHAYLSSDLSIARLHRDFLEKYDPE